MLYIFCMYYLYVTHENTMWHQEYKRETVYNFKIVVSGSVILSVQHYDKENKNEFYIPKTRNKF